MQGIEDGVMLREHAHRVANDMAVAAAALRHADRLVGGNAVIAAAIARLDAVGRVQRLFCVRPAGSVVDLTRTLTELCGAMSLARLGEDGAVAVSGPELPVGDGEARLVAMCVHELVGNALRHARGSGGGVRVEVSDECGTTTVAILDRGGARDWSRAGGQGALIVDQLAATLRGSVVRSVSATGGRVSVSMPTLAAAAIPALEAA